MTSREIQNCPFCGAEAILEILEGSAYVICKSCLCCTNHFDTDVEAIKAWNNRHISKQDLQEAVDKGLVGIDEEKVENIVEKTWCEMAGTNTTNYERFVRISKAIAAASPIKVLDKE